MPIITVNSYCLVWALVSFGYTRLSSRSDNNDHCGSMLLSVAVNKDSLIACDMSLCPTLKITNSSNQGS